MAEENVESVVEENTSFLGSVYKELVDSPLNMFLVVIIAFLIYKIFKSKTQVPTSSGPAEPELPKLRRDFTVQELKAFDGKQPDGRVLVAVNGSVYDCTKGKKFYGPGGPYAAFGGRDASRGLATFSITSSETDYDDLSDLNVMEMDSVREWEMQFKEKYTLVGRLLKPGEQHASYSDEDEDTNTETSTTTSNSASTVTAAAPASPKPEKKSDAGAGSGAEEVGDVKKEEEKKNE